MVLENKKPGKFRTIWNKIKKPIKWTATSLLFLHLATQINYSFNEIRDEVSPSKKQQEFKDEFGFPLIGFSKDLFKGPDLSNICAAIQYERAQRDFDINFLRVKSKDYLNKSWVEQFDQFFIGGSSYFNPFDDGISVEKNCRFNTMHHEIKHAKTWEIKKEHPALIDEWKRLALDGDGNSLYLDGTEQFCLRIRFLNGLLNKKKFVTDENRKLGFISDYARINVYEDIAELCTEAEVNPGDFNKFIYGNDFKHDGDFNPTIVAKLNLAEKYGLIPKEFSEYLEVLKLKTGGMDCDFHKVSTNRKKIIPFFVESEKFLNEHPGSIYSINLRVSRAEAYREMCPSNKEDLENAVREYKQALNSGFKDNYCYALSLQYLPVCYSDLGDDKRRELYHEAQKEWRRRHNSGDILLTKRGVNDFLIARGEKLEVR